MLPLKPVLAVVGIISLVVLRSTPVQFYVSTKTQVDRCLI